MMSEPTFSDRFYALERKLRELSGEKVKPPDETSWRRMSIGPPSSMLGEKKEVPVERGTGFVEARPLAPPPGIDLIDKICRAEADREKAEALFRAKMMAEGLKKKGAE
jgi:hypothetical protein